MNKQNDILSKLMNGGYMPGKLIKYTPQSLWDKFVDYYNTMKDDKWERSEVLKGGDRAGELIPVPVTTPMTLAGFCCFACIPYSIGAHTKQGGFINWTKDSENPLHEVSLMIKQIIQQQQLEGSMINAFNPYITARVLGLADKQEMSGPDGSPIEHEVKEIKHTINFNNYGKKESDNTEAVHGGSSDKS